MRELLYILALLFFPAFIAAQSQDTLSRIQDKEVISDTSFRSPSVPIQIVVGSAAFVGCFYGLGGKELFDPNSSSTFSWYPVAMPVFVGGIVGGIGELTSQRSGTYLASIGGALLGQFIGLGFYHLIKKAGAGDILAYPAYAFPPLFLSIFFFNNSLSPSKSDTETSMLCFPVVSKDNISMNILVQF